MDGYKLQGREEYSKKINDKIEQYFNQNNSILQNFYYAIESTCEPVTCFNYIDTLCRCFNRMGCDSNEKILRVTKADIDRFFHTIQNITDKQGNVKMASSACKRSYYSALKKFYDYLYEDELIKKNPMAKVKCPKMTDEVEHVSLKVNDLQSIVNKAEVGIDKKWVRARHDKWGERDVLIMTLLVTTGMRVTAMIEINVSDIDFANKELTILDKRHKKHVYPLGNNAVLMGAIEKWLVKRQKILREMGKLGTTDALIISNRGGRMTRPAIEYITKKYSSEAVDKPCSPHKFRSSFCTTLYESCRDIEFVRDAVGHEKAETTMKYIKKTDNAKDRAGQMMSDFLLGK